MVEDIKGEFAEQEEERMAEITGKTVVGETVAPESKMIKRTDGNIEPEAVTGKEFAQILLFCWSDKS